MDPMELRAYIGTADGCLVVVIVLAVLIAAVCELVNGTVMRAVVKRSWWPSASQLQKQAMVSFGYSDEACTPDSCLQAYAYTILVCGAHLLCASLMLPVMVLGWSGAGPTGQLLFMMGALADVGYDVYDSLKIFVLTFLPNNCKCLGTATPLQVFVIMVCMHHTLAMMLVIPMILGYGDLPEFHRIACSLLLAAGVALSGQQYKLALNVTDRRELLQYKAITLLQFATVWITRFFIWFPNAFWLLRFFHERGDTPFLVGGIAGGVGMTLFNIVMLLDATTDAVKWLPMPAPSPDAERDGLKSEIAAEQRQAILPAPTTEACAEA